MDYSRYPEEHHIDVEIRERVAVLTLNRPERRNAVNYPMHAGLERIFSELGSDADVGAVLLTGAGSAFCAGGDVKGFNPPDSSLVGMYRGTRNLVLQMAQCETPMVAAVNGPAAGLGATLALLCDVIYMGHNARIGDTHVKMGLVAGDGGAVIWPLLVGPHRAKECLMSGKLLTGSEAEAMGLVNHAVPDDKVVEEAFAYARSLAEGPQAAIRWTKLAINQVLWQNINLVLGIGAATEHLSAETEDQKEAVAAFIEKRKPVFTGR